MSEQSTDLGLLYADAQQSVVGSLLISPEACAAVVRDLREEDFSVPELRTVYAAIRRLWLDRKSVDPVTVLAAVGSEYESVLRDAMRFTPTAANIAAHARIVREEAALTAIREAGEKLAGSRRLDEAREVLAAAENLAIGNPGVRAVGILEALQRGYVRASDPEKKPEWINWGFPKINDRVRCPRGKFVVLAADSSVGKTSFGLQLAWNIASRGMRVGFYSVETDSDTLTERISAQRLRIPMDKIQTQDLEEQDFRDWLALMKPAGEMCLELIEASDMTLEEIRADILYRRLDVAFIDYLQLLEAPGFNATEQVRNISRYVHRMAQTLNVTIVGLSQVTVPADAPDKWVPTMESLRESKQLKNDADVVFLLYLHKQSQRDGVRWLAIAKNKQGTLGRIPMAFAGEYQWFSVTNPPPDDPAPARKQKSYQTQPPPAEFTELPEADQREIAEVFSGGAGR